MIIKMDTREKANKKDNILSYFARHKIEVERIKLSVGDYAIKGKEEVVIDLKRNILELAQDFFCDKKRFERECQRAKNTGILLIFLIEEKFDKAKLMKWTAPKDVNGKRFMNVYGWQIYNEMIRYIQLFGVKFKCCHKNATGRMIIELLEKYSTKTEPKTKNL